MRRIANVVLLGFFVLLVVLVGFVGYGILEFLHPSEHVLLNWCDPDAGITFSVRERQAGVVENISTFVAGQNSVTIDDKMPWGTISFVRFRDWLLVLNGPYVVSGYNYNTKRMIAEGQWSELPFTIRERVGTVVAANKAYWSKPEPPRGLPEISEAAFYESQAQPPNSPRSGGI